MTLPATVRMLAMVALVVAGSQAAAADAFPGTETPQDLVSFVERVTAVTDPRAAAETLLDCVNAGDHVETCALAWVDRALRA